MGYGDRLACGVPARLSGSRQLMSEQGPTNGSTGAMTFTRRPTSLPPDIRPEWRVPLLLLLTSHCRGRLASREQLHVLNSAILNDGSRRALLATLDGRIAPQTPIVQFEPALDRAIDRCVGLGLLEYMASGRLKVSDLGASVVQALDADADLFTRE